MQPLHSQARGRPPERMIYTITSCQTLSECPCACKRAYLAKPAETRSSQHAEIRGHVIITAHELMNIPGSQRGTHHWRSAFIFNVSLAWWPIQVLHPEQSIHHFFPFPDKTTIHGLRVLALKTSETQARNRVHILKGSNDTPSLAKRRLLLTDGGLICALPLVRVHLHMNDSRATRCDNFLHRPCRWMFVWEGLHSADDQLRFV